MHELTARAQAENASHSVNVAALTVPYACAGSRVQLHAGVYARLAR